MSTPSRSAARRAAIDGRTWKPMMIASDAAARVTSLSEISPTALCRTLTWISSVDSLMSESLRASIEPSTSPLTMILSSWKLPMARRRPISSSVRILVVRSPCSRCNCSRLEAISRASCSVSSTLKVSPAVGAPFRPKISAGHAGPASLMRWLRSLNIALTLPKWLPARIISPTRSVPFCTSTVATYPRPLSSDDSMMLPVAFRLGLALRSSISASRSTFSISSGTPVPFLAEMSCD